eukprot:7083335-Heterocapsa_arctica.AAC.1
MGRIVVAPPEADPPAALPLRIVLGPTTGPPLPLIALSNAETGVLPPTGLRPPGPLAEPPARPDLPELLP